MKKIFRNRRTGVSVVARLVGLGALLTACGSDPESNDPGHPDGSSPEAGVGVDAGADSGSPSKDGGHDDATLDGGVDSSQPQPGTPFNVYTQHNDNSRTGANLTETTLNTANVNQQQFGKLFCRAVDDEIYNQPLIVTGVDIKGKGKHDVLYVASVNDTVYAFDANDPAQTAPLWSTSFLSGGVVPPSNTDMTGACGGGYTDYSGHIGIVGTPVIDPKTNTMYFVARTLEGGINFVQKLHAIDITDGSERANSPTTIDASVVNGAGAPVTFDPQKNNQRTALLLVDGILYMGWSSHCDWGPYHGWLLGYDAATLQQVAVFTTTPNGTSGGIWMAGQGPAADTDGNIYISTGNGSVGFNNNPSDPSNRAESFLRLRKTGNALTIASWFTPVDYQRLENGDLDLGSAGLLLIPDTNSVVSAGKGGTIYQVDRTTMGALSTDRTDSQVLMATQMAPGKHLHGSPVYWKGPGGAFVYTWAEYDHLKTFRVDSKTSKMDPIPVITSVNPAPDGMPGGMLSISANADTDGSGVIWANMPLIGDANNATVHGVLRAFDAANVGRELWSSQDNAPRDDFGDFAKFTPPTVANGKVYLSTFSNQVCVYGLLPGVTAPNAPSDLAAKASSKTSAVLTWKDNSKDETSFVIERRQGVVGYVQIATATANATTYTDSTGTPFANYTYRVRAIAPQAPSAYSNPASVVLDAGNPEARLQIEGAGHSIAAGSTTVSATNDTDFGAVSTGQTTTHTFTMDNIGNAALHLSGPVTIGGADATSFAIGTAPPATVAPAGTATFTVTFAPTTTGAKHATINVASDDPAQATYTFAIAATGMGDLVGWWKLDEAAGNHAADSSGLANDGNGNALTWGAGHVGNAAIFDGSTTFLQILDNASLDPDSMTVAAWIKPTQWAGGNRRVIQKGAGDNQFRLTEENNTFFFQIAGVGTATAPALPTLNVWTHVAATYDRANIRLYINGVQVAAVAATAPSPLTSDSLFIGVKTDASTPGDHFSGSIDDVRIYRRALAAGEITTLAQ